MDRPVISFLTDFGPESAPAICRGVMLSIARDAQIIDISHTVRTFAIDEGAYLLWSALPWLPVGVHVAVVDPGVGTARLPIALRVGRGDVLVGPDNGLLRPAAAVLGGLVEARALENPALMLPRQSSTFHGRDIFAPVAAHLANGVDFELVGRSVPNEELADLAFPAPEISAGSLVATVAYIDAFGNVRLHAGAADLAAATGRLEAGQSLALVVIPAEGSPEAATSAAAWSRTFGERSPGETLVYEDSSGRLAIADNQGNAAKRLGIGTGRRVRLHSGRS